MIDFFTSVKKEAKAEIYDTDSKFIGITKQVSNEEEAEKYLEQIRREYSDADQICYAYSVIIETGRQKKEKSFDDKEPQGTAGRPMLEVIKNFKLTNTIVVAVRYKGQSLLGVNGLIKAYREIAEKTIKLADADVKVYSKIVEIGIEYNEAKKFDALMDQTAKEVECIGLLLGNDQKAKECKLWASEHTKILEKSYEDEVYYTLAIPVGLFKDNMAQIQNLLKRKDFDFKEIDERYE